MIVEVTEPSNVLVKMLFPPGTTSETIADNTGSAGAELGSRTPKSGGPVGPAGITAGVAGKFPAGATPGSVFAGLITIAVAVPPACAGRMVTVVKIVPVTVAATLTTGPLNGLSCGVGVRTTLVPVPSPPLGGRSIVVGARPVKGAVTVVNGPKKALRGPSSFPSSLPPSLP